MYQRHADQMQSEVVDDEEYYAEGYARQKRGVSSWLKKFTEPSTIVMLLVLIATSAFFWTTRVLVTEAKRSFEANTRAWVAPIAAALATKTENGKPINIALQYNNVGRTPASDINIRYQLHVFPNEAFDNGQALTAIAQKNICESLEPANGSEVLYPGPAGGTLILAVTPTDPKTGNRIPLYDTYMSGNHTLAAQFCVAYRTSGVTHKSAFCFFHRPDSAVGQALNKCAVGNHAD